MEEYSTDSNRRRGRPSMNCEYEAGSASNLARIRSMVSNLEQDENGEMLASQLSNRLHPMPDLNLDYLERSLQREVSDMES